MSFRERLASDEVLGGVLCVIPSAVVTQAVAAAGADFVIIDCEHGPVGREAMHAMIAATAGTRCAPLVRVPGVLEPDVKAALDAGAEGVVYPLIRSAEDAERAVSFVTYPPAGARGWGPFVAHSHHGVALGDYLSEVGPRIACVLLIETVEAVANIDAILAVPGIDLIVLAQFDLSTALGVHGRFDAAEFLEAVATVERAAASAGVPLGTSGLTPEQSRAAVEAGYRVLIHGFDVLMLKQQVAAFRGWTEPA